MLGKGHQIASPTEIAIVICRYVGDEVGGLTLQATPIRLGISLLPHNPQVDMSRNRCGTRVSGPVGGLPWTCDDCNLVAIPAWNEEGSIAQVIDQVGELVPHADVLAVDDGSTDATARLAHEAGAQVASLPFNVGVGGAMRTAFLFAARNDYQALVQVDADGQHDPTDLVRLISGLDEADVVVGTRFHPDSMYFVGGPRRWAMVLLSKALSRMAKTPITDSTSGFRSAGPRAISLFAEQYPAEYLGDTVGSLAIAIRNDLVIRETPVTMYYRAIGRPSKNALWSALYLGRASLALFVTLLQRRNPGKKDVS